MSEIVSSVDWLKIIIDKFSKIYNAILGQINMQTDSSWSSSE